MDILRMSPSHILNGNPLVTEVVSQTLEQGQKLIRSPAVAT